MQYNNIRKSYIIITPYDRDYEIELKQYPKCGIDIGCRTFLTVYSPEKVYENGTSKYTYQKIDLYNKKIDTLQKLKDEKIINIQKYEITSTKYRERIKKLYRRTA